MQKNGGGAALLVLFLTASDVFAQTTRYIAPGGPSSGDCTLATPCSLYRALNNFQSSNGDTFLLQIPYTGGSVVFAQTGVALTQSVTFGTYVQGSSGTAVEGTVEFSGGFFIGTPNGQFKLHEKATVEFHYVTIFGGVTARAADHYVFAGANEPEQRIVIRDSLSARSGSARLDRLVVSQDLFLAQGTTARPGRISIDNGLTVKRGATLTLGRDLYLRLKKGESSTDPQGILQVDGEITQFFGAGNTLYLMHPPQTQADNTPVRDSTFFIPTSKYNPANGVDYTDCLRIRGSGMINVPMRIVAMGNVCVELKRIGGIAVGGSIEERDTERQKKNITTDLIFRNDVVLNGNLLQYHDARIVFEKTATIRRGVGLRSGTQPDIPYGVARGAGVRKGVRSSTTEKYKCEYVTKGGKMRAAHIPGIQFEDEVTIEGDFYVNSHGLTGTAISTDVDTNDTECLPRVLFMAPVARTTGPTWIANTSHIGGNLVVKGGDTSRVYLDYDSLTTNQVKRETTHSLRIGGDLSASGVTIGMGHPKTFTNTGMCEPTKVTPGNGIMLTGRGKHIVAGTLTLGALQAEGDLDVRDGTLTVKHLHVQPGGELKANDNVVVGETLILEGDGLSGTLSDASTIKTLVYGSPDTDFVQPVAMAALLEAFTVDLGDGGELRLDQVTKTKNLGLCSGTLALREAGTATDSTLSVHEQITVKNGRIKKDMDNKGSIATDANRYHLKYITPGKLTVTDALEWFNPQDVTVDHRSAEIMVEGTRSLMGTLTVTNGKLIVDGMVTAANVTLENTSEFHTKADKVVVNGKVMVKGTSQFLTGGGDVNVLGQVRGGRYTNNTAEVTVEAKAKIDLGTGTLMLGPEDTATRAAGTARPDVKLTLHGDLMGRISVPKGSKETMIDAATIAADSMGKTLGTITFDGKMPSARGTTNSDGTLRLLSTAEKPLMVDSLSAMNGTVEFKNKKVTIMKDVHLRSATISPYSEATEFKGNLTLSGTGGLSTKNNMDTLSVVIHGDFRQTKGESTDSSGVNLQGKTTKTVMGNFLVAKDAAPYKANKKSTLILEGDFHHMKEDTLLHAKLEFKGEEAQEVKTGMKTELDSVVVDNAKGLRLASSVIQRKTATLTLRQGRIMNADTTAMADSRYSWAMKNPKIEEDLRNRMSALEAKKCGTDEDEACTFSISRGSVQSHASVPFIRHLEHGNSGEGATSGGYLFPVGSPEEEGSHYRPLILQLPFDEDPVEATVSLVPKEDIPANLPALNISTPTSSGESLMLDVHSNLFWKIETELETEVNIRVAATGLPNVSNVKRLRIVQWNCETETWTDPKLAGRYNETTDTASFRVNDHIGRVVNLTQERINLGACTILGIAANGVENPIDQENLTGERAQIQFIHNLPLPTPVELHLGDIRIRSGLQFREATAYRAVSAGDYALKIQAVGAPAEQMIADTSLTLGNNRNYVVIAHGSIAAPKLKVLRTNLTSSVTNKAEVILVHGASDLGTVDVRVLDASDNSTPLMIIADNIPFDGKTSYRALDPSMHNVQVSSPNNEEEFEVFPMNLNGYGNQTLVLNLSGNKRDLRILGVDKNGMILLPDAITGVEAEHVELPTEFALHGNYPNPFNPSTRIQFDLPETAEVRVQIVDMLGREVMSLPAQEFEAGANRSLEINATSLASGTYLYRMIAIGTEERHVKTGRMTLIK